VEGSDGRRVRKGHGVEGWWCVWKRDMLAVGVCYAQMIVLAGSRNSEAG
jgi:hypothetical protein